MDRLRREDQGQVPLVEGGVMVRVRKGETKPPGARRLTEEEVLDKQHKIINSWQPPSEMWPFTWGMGVLGVGSVLSGVAVNALCRKQLTLGRLSRLTTLAPTVGLPLLLSTFFHHFLVTKPILLGDFPCTVCAAARSGGLQAAVGGAYPALLAPLLCVAVARKHHAYPVPGLRDAARILPFLRAVLPPSAALLPLVIANFALGAAISERQTFLFAKYLSPTSGELSRRTESEDEFFQ